MKATTFTTNEGDKVTISISSSTEEMYRIYMEGEQFIEKDDNLGNKIPICLHLTRKQANILINALEDLFDEDKCPF